MFLSVSKRSEPVGTRAARSRDREQPRRAPEEDAEGRQAAAGVGARPAWAACPPGVGAVHPRGGCHGDSDPGSSVGRAVDVAGLEGFGSQTF